MRITNNEKSYGRNLRLFQVVTFYYEMMLAKGYSQDRGGKYEGDGSLPLGSTPLVALHDHKGDLTVTWASAPSDFEVRCMEIAWEKAGGESSENVSHEVGGA